MTTFRLLLVLTVLSALFAVVSHAQNNPAPAASVASAPAAAQPLDVNAAVDFYLAKMPASERSRSNAYFEGGYWLLLWDFVVIAFVMWLFLRFRWSTRLRDLAERITRFKPLQTAIYWALFIAILTVITFPWTVYESYFREHQYNLLNQTFGSWFRDQAVSLAVSVVLGAVLMIPLFGLVRKLGKNWWVWGAALMIVF